MKDERDMVGSLHPQAVADAAFNIGDELLARVKAGLLTGRQVREALDIALDLREIEARPPLPRLDELAKKHGTDKGPAEHNYTPLYEDKFWLHRYEALTLLELGIYRGASLRMWRDYFPIATIIGLDRNKTLNGDFEQYDVVQVQSDQNDDANINRVGSMYGPLHIVIDDASHISSKTIQSFKLLWPHLAPGGIYVIEDLQTSYDPANYGQSEAHPDPDMRPRQGAWTAMQFCKRLADEVNAGLYPDECRLGYDIASVEFHLNICFITKSGKWSAA